MTGGIKEVNLWVSFYEYKHHKKLKDELKNAANNICFSSNN
jgi:hypothetical protein